MNEDSKALAVDQVGLKSKQQMQQLRDQQISEQDKARVCACVSLILPKVFHDSQHFKMKKSMPNCHSTRMWVLPK